MQGILISLATAAIIAIGGAFAAPFVVDWNAWRGTFETEVSRAIGLPVVIRGDIDATILPAPRVVLHDVSLGDVVSSGGTVRTLTAELSLGALLRGDVEATGVGLDRPDLRLVLDSTGRLAVPPGSAAPAHLAIAQFTVDNGSIEILDRAADRSVRLDDLDLKGEARSLNGPFKLDGEVAGGGGRYGLRASLGQIGEDGTGRLRLLLDGRARPFALDLDGSLGAADGTPRFEGRATLVRKAPAASPPTPVATSGAAAWSVSAALKASPEAVLASSLDVTLGDAVRPVQLSGSARLSLGRDLGFDAVLNARSADLDVLRPADGAAAQTPAGVLTGLAAAFAALPPTDVRSRIGVAVEQLTLGGTVVRDARADLSGSPAGWRIDTFEAALPGKASLRLSGVPGRGADGATFAGDISFQADDPAAFLRWAVPRAAPEYVAAVKAPVRLAGRLSAGPARLSVENLDAAFGSGKVRGSAAAALSAKEGPRLDLRLSLDTFDLDPLVAALREAAVTVGGGADATLALDGRNLTLAGLPMKALSIEAAAVGGSWRVARLLADDLGGIRLEGKGWMENFSTVPRGQLDARVAGARADGLVPLVRLMAGDEAAAVMRRLVPVAAPVKLSSAAEWGQNGSRSFAADGTLGLLAGKVTFARPQAGVPMRVELGADAADGARVLEALGLSGLRPGLGPGRLDLAVEPVTDREANARGRLALAGATLMGQGRVRLGADGAYQPRLDMSLEAADLGRLVPQVGAAGDNAPVPAALAFTLGRNGTAWRADGLSGSLAGAPLTGTLDLEPGETPRLGGALAFDTLSLPRILGLFGTRAAGPDGGGPWPAGRFALPAAGGVGLGLDLSARRLALYGPYALDGARLRLVGDGADLDVREIAGALGQGRLAGNLAVRRRGEMVQADGRLVLDAVDAAALLAPLAGRSPPRGLVSLSLDLGGSGRTPLALVQALSGQGTLTVRSLELDGTDPGAMDAVLAETASGPPPDEKRTVQMLERALASGPLSVPLVETTLGVVNGAARLSPARAAAASVRLAFTGSLDLSRLAMDAALDMEGNEVSGGVPGATVSWRGPVAAPERRVAAASLTAVIAMRAIERETRRLEERQGAGQGQGQGQGQGLGQGQVPAIPTAPAGLGTDSPAAPAAATPAAGRGAGTGSAMPAVSPPPAISVSPLPAPTAQPQPSPALPPAVPSAVQQPSPAQAPSTPAVPARPAPIVTRPAPPAAPEAPTPVQQSAAPRPARPAVPPPQDITPHRAPSRPIESELPPTPGFGNLPRPPASVGQGLY